MPVTVDPDGRRSISVEVEVPGTPEAVWRAIATGPGISAWFVPTEVEEREGGAVRSSFGPGMDSLAHITAWEPPHRFAADSRDDVGPNDPTVATEWTVETKGGGTCIVRVTHAWFLDDDRWDAQYEGHSYGWIGFFRILKGYLSDFAGQDCRLVALSTMTGEADAWQRLIGPLGLVDPGAGDRFDVATPRLAGSVVDPGIAAFPNLMLRIEAPSAGIASLFPMPMGGQTLLTVRFYLYGRPAPEAAAAAMEAEWSTWLAERFAPVAAS
jgi:uncharacterized protein YndB with AHSA1/START domain